MITYFGQTDVGKRRNLNEDSILTSSNLFIVCDGMGGHKAGEVASGLAVEVISRFVERSAEDDEITWPYGFETGSSRDANRLRTSVKLANRMVFRKAASSDDYTGMGTTASAVLLASSRPRITYANVGDSRIYLLRGGTIQQLSRDDSWANLPWGPEGADPNTTLSMQHVLTKALGAQEEVDFEVNTLDLADGDTLLLCSDGLTNMVTDKELLEIATTRGKDVEGAVREMVDRANAAGGRDNISAVMLSYAA
jgi:PPM family protein phosphatase